MELLSLNDLFKLFDPETEILKDVSLLQYASPFNYNSEGNVSCWRVTIPFINVPVTHSILGNPIRMQDCQTKVLTLQVSVMDENGKIFISPANYEIPGLMDIVYNGKVHRLENKLGTGELLDYESEEDFDLTTELQIAYSLLEDNAIYVSICKEFIKSAKLNVFALRMAIKYYGLDDKFPNIVKNYLNRDALIEATKDLFDHGDVLNRMYSEVTVLFGLTNKGEPTTRLSDAIAGTHFKFSQYGIPSIKLTGI